MAILFFDAVLLRAIDQQMLKVLLSVEILSSAMLSVPTFYACWGKRYTGRLSLSKS
jgi:hypothetical protein